MSDGTLSLRRRDPKASELASSNLQNTALKSGAYEYFADFENIFGTGHVKDKSAATKGREERVIGAVDEFRVESVKRKKLRPYDKFLKEFKYGAALDAVMENVSSMTLYGDWDSRIDTLVPRCRTSDQRPLSPSSKNLCTETAFDQH
jgi:U3 small nucleolar RNA-associated protein 15